LPAFMATGQVNAGNLAESLALLTVGSLLPDVYHPPVRRNAFLHSLVGAAVASSVATVLISAWLYTLGIPVTPGDARFMFRLVFSAYLMHLVGDSLTGGGVYLSWPFNPRRFRISARRYDDPALNSIFYGLGILALALSLSYLWVDQVRRVMFP